MFTAEFFTGNRQRLLNMSGADLIVLSGHGLLQQTMDKAFPFYQESNFWYLCGLEKDPDLTLVMSKQGQFVILPARDPHRDTWEGPLDIAGMKHQSGLLFYDHDQGWKLLKDLLHRSPQIYTLLAPPIYSSVFGMYTNPARAHLLRRLKRLQPNLKVQDLRPLLRDLRVIKQDVEIKAIVEAIDVTEAAFDELPRVRKKAHQEKAIERYLTSEYVLAGAEHAFEPIVAGGIRSTILHYQDNDQPIEDGDPVLIDSGAALNRYRADVTRVLPPRRGFTKRQSQVYESVLSVLDDLIDFARPGVSHYDFEGKAQELIGLQLHQLGLAAKKPKLNQIAHYCPHAASHQLGIDTHDLALGDEVLAENMVLAIEPGIYVPEEGFGVRLEHNIVITKSGTKCLTRDVLPPEKLLR